MATRRGQESTNFGFIDSSLYVPPLSQATVTADTQWYLTATSYSIACGAAQSTTPFSAAIHTGTDGFSVPPSIMDAYTAVPASNGQCPDLSFSFQGAQQLAQFNLRTKYRRFPSAKMTVTYLAPNPPSTLVLRDFYGIFIAFAVKTPTIFWNT